MKTELSNGTLEKIHIVLLSEFRLESSYLFNQEVLPIFKTFEEKIYFLLKSKTAKALCSNVIHKFTDLCDTNTTYISIEASRH